MAYSSSSSSTSLRPDPGIDVDEDENYCRHAVQLLGLSSIDELLELGFPSFRDRLAHLTQVDESLKTVMTNAFFVLLGRKFAAKEERLARQIQEWENRERSRILVINEQSRLQRNGGVDMDTGSPVAPVGEPAPCVVQTQAEATISPTTSQGATIGSDTRLTPITPTISDRSPSPPSPPPEPLQSS
ncbi:hypothetical protein HDU76_004526 [Blyttiomyces sp. JEL0837]|nr:hypothetical protein HDU76_004526 [Blyttiomyces sp. JEL0837]